MKHVRTAVIATVALGLLLPATSAQAVVKKKPHPSAKPACNLILDTDPAGDAPGLVSAEAGLDIVSGDISSNSKVVTAVIRLAGPPPKAGNTNAPDGTAYYLQWSVPGATNPVYLNASSDPTGAFTYAMGSVTPQPGGKGSLNQNKAGLVTGHVDGNVITMSVDRATLASLADVKPGLVLSELQASSYYTLEVPKVGGALQPGDSVAGKKSYVAGSPSCVKPGS